MYNAANSFKPHRQSNSRAQMPSTVKLLLILAGGLALLGVCVWQWERTARQNPALDAEPEVSEPPLPLDHDLPPVVRSQSPYLNTTDEAAYVGNEACLKCHEDESQSYQHTGHSRALAKADPANEPPDAEFYHSNSKRWYKVYRAEGRLHHREFIRDEKDRELVLSDYPIAWTIGSGRFSKSYLVEDEGFLIESPITWYASKNAWDMSPGYEGPEHQGFERLADLGCVVCHAGQAAETDGNSFRPQILQATIGCENCHGPGSLHVARHESPTPPTDETDLTIVNPAHLERGLSESLCGNCHLRGDASIVRRGVSLTDFRPGLPLSDIRIDYGSETPQGEMEVVGHMEQMRQSLCYTKSETMTCITCHDPHHPPKPEDKIAAYRSVCLDCHTEESCGLPKPKRLEQTQADDCVSCHMPTTDTDIPHFAFTHHRIAKPGTHKTSKVPKKNETPSVLKPLAEGVERTKSESDRNLGLAYLEYAEKQPSHYKYHLYHAGQLLERGAPDSECLAALARVYFETGLETASIMAEEALRAKGTTSSSRSNALIVRGTHLLQGGQLSLAQKDFEQLTQLKRHTAYWQMLADAHRRQGHLPEALDALEKAVRIAPNRVELRQLLRNELTSSGQPQKAEPHQRAIEILTAPRKPAP